MPMHASVANDTTKAITRISIFYPLLFSFQILSHLSTIACDLITVIPFIVYKPYRGLLDKTKMVNANRKLEDGKEDLDKKEIKETLHRIETTLGNLKREMEEGKKFTFRSVFSSFLIATGLGMISISIRHDPIATVSGVCMLVVGAVILSRCFIKFKRI